jgi:hypothetical protein
VPGQKEVAMVFLASRACRWIWNCKGVVELVTLLTLVGVPGLIILLLGRP